MYASSRSGFPKAEEELRDQARSVLLLVLVENGDLLAEGKIFSCCMID